MKKIYSYFFIAITIVLLTACSQIEETEVIYEVKGLGYQLFAEEMIKDNYHLISVEDENFVLNTYVNKLSFEENEKIDIFSTLEYVGKKESIQIWSIGSLYLMHNIFDGNIDYNTSVVNTIITTSKLNRGNVYLVPFEKRGSWNPEDEFWDQYFTDKDLKLSKGEYVFSAETRFSLDKDLIDKVRLKTELQIKVH